MDEAVEYLTIMGNSCSLDVADEVATYHRTYGRRRLGRLLGMTPAGAQQEIARAEALHREADDG